MYESLVEKRVVFTNKSKHSRMYNQNKPLPELKLVGQHVYALWMKAYSSFRLRLLLNDLNNFQLYDQVQYNSNNTVSSHGAHFGKGFASKADKLQKGAAYLHHSMLGRKKIAEEGIWRMIEMHFCISYTENIRRQPFHFKRIHKHLKKCT